MLLSNLSNHPWTIAKFDESKQASSSSLVGVLKAHNNKRSIHLAIPRVRLLNARENGPPGLHLSSSEDIATRVFELAVEQDAFFTAFGAFSRPHPRSAPLSLLGISRESAAIMEARYNAKMWSSVSGAQYAFNSPHPKGIEAWIKRAAQTSSTLPPLPLNFHIAPPDWKYDEDGNGVNEDIKDEATPAILRIFIKNAAQWNHIAFDLNAELAEIYLAGVKISQPEQVKYVELFATDIQAPELALRVFKSVETYSGSVTKFLWGGPPGIRLGGAPTLPAPPKVDLPKLKVLGLDVTTVSEIEGCLEKLNMPALEELKICFAAASNTHDVEWRSDVNRLLESIKKLTPPPKVLWIHDDAFGGRGQDMIYTLAKRALKRNVVEKLVVRPVPLLEVVEVVVRRQDDWDVLEQRPAKRQRRGRECSEVVRLLRIGRAQDECEGAKERLSRAWSALDRARKTRGRGREGAQGFRAAERAVDEAKRVQEKAIQKLDAIQRAPHQDEDDVYEAVRDPDDGGVALTLK